MVSENDGKAEPEKGSRRVEKGTTRATARAATCQVCPYIRALDVGEGWLSDNSDRPTMTLRI